MGADVHVAVMAKQEDGTYKNLRIFVKNADGEMEDRTDFGPWADRNYPLFGQLADVRGYADELEVGQYGIFKDAPKDVKEMFNSEYLFARKYFEWTSLKQVAKATGEIEDDWNEGKTWNPTLEWMRGLQVILDLHKIWYPEFGQVIIQVAFDN